MSIIIENELDKSREDKSEREVTISENEISSKNTEFFHLYHTKFPSSNTLLKKFKNLNFIMLIINIIGIIFHQISFIGCHGGEENYCVTEFLVQFTILGSLLIISTLIVSISITLILWGKIFFFHLLYIIPIYYIYFYYFDRGETLERHGHINYIFFNIFLVIFLIVINYIILLFRFFKKKKYISFICLISLLLFFPIYHFYVNIKSKCVNYEYGLNNEKIIKLPNELCSFYPPKKCELDYYFGKFNISKFRITNYNSKKTAVKYLPKTIKKSNYLGFPIVKFHQLKNPIDNYEYNTFVSENMVDMETFIPNQGIPTPEIRIKFNKKGKGRLEINLIKNESLILERKKLENPNSLFKNVLFIYIDTASRLQFKRGLKKLFSFFESYMINNKEPKKKNYSVFQFFKYHSLGAFTHINVQPMLYGMSMESNKGIEFNKYYKENGYITAFSLSLCSPDIINDKTRTYTKYVEKYPYDHEMNMLFCDPNYFDREFGGTSYKGSNNFSKRILYNQQVNEIQIEYAKQFWEKYKESQKFLKLCFMDGHEDTSETVKFLDEPLTNFLTNLYNDNLLNNTAIIIASDHGLHMPRIHLLFSREQFIHDKNLPLLLMFYDNRNLKLNNNEIGNNQQKFVTVYDIYETLLHICFGEEKFTNQLGRSLFGFIDESKRSCDFYPELKKSDCRCILNK